MATPGATSNPDQVTIVCLHCNRAQEIARKAMSITCRYCSKSLKLEDILFKTYEARRNVETCGIVTVEKKANLVTTKIHCGGMVVRGKVKGDITARGPVFVGPEAEIKGDVSAPTVAIGAGAILDGNYKIGPTSSPPTT